MCTSHGSRVASVFETMELLEWCIVLGPLCFLATRLLGWESVLRPELFALAQFVFVVLLMFRERHRGVGDKERAMEKAATAKKGEQHPTERSVAGRLVHFCTDRTCGTDRHKPVKTSVKGASCFLFALPALDILASYDAAPVVYADHMHEVAMLLGQCVFSFMADHVMVPHSSSWHPADRVCALTLTSYAFVKPYVFGCNLEDTLTSTASVAAACVYFSQIARRHHGLATHHVHHAIFHVIVAAGWNYSNRSLHTAHFLRGYGFCSADSYPLHC